MTDPRIEELQRLLPQCLLHDWVRLGSRLVRLLRHPHAPHVHDALVDRLLQQARESAEWRIHRQEHLPRVSHPPELPISQRRDEIVAAIRAHQVVVIAGETGSGKTTQLPKMCLDAGLGIEARIGCTQPRRVAALSISQRIAEELNVEWGREVGCKIRFDDRSGPETYIKLMTDGILLAEVQGDPLLSDYNAIIVDEAHERSLNIDFLLGHLKGLLRKRPDLKIIITSATIDTAAFSKAFNDAPVIEVSGRVHPVDIEYRPYLDTEDPDAAEMTYVEAAVDATLDVLTRSDDGDVLIFMPSERDIREARDMLEGHCGSGVEVIPLFGRLSAGDQQRVFSPSRYRKLIVATNIAETSLTLPGIRFVIDTGLARISRYNSRTRTRRLPIEPIAQSSANQRKGRAGRVRHGVCIRLYSEEDFDKRPLFTQPEMLRANLAEVLLRLKAFRLGDIETFPFVNPPTPAAIQAAYSLLIELGALDTERQLTSLGNRLARLPIDPTLGRMLLQSDSEQATSELLVIAAALSIQDPRERPSERQAEADAAHRSFSDPRSDFLGLLKLWEKINDVWASTRSQSQRRKFCQTHYLSYTRIREWQDLHQQLGDVLDDLKLGRPNATAASYDAIHRSILSGLLGHVARRIERNVYEGQGRRELSVFPGSALFERTQRPPKRRGPPSGESRKPTEKENSHQPEWIVAGEVVETSQRFARSIAGINPEWIAQIAPQLCEVQYRHPHWNVRSGRVVAEEVTLFQGMEIASRRIAYGTVRPAEATAIFVQSALVEEQLLPLPSLSTDSDDDLDLTIPDRRGKHHGNARGRIHFPLTDSLDASDQGTRAQLESRFPFIAHNRRIRERIDDLQNRVRRAHHIDIDRTLQKFYLRHLEGISTRDDLQRHLRSNPDPSFLCVEETDLTGGTSLDFDPDAFPDEIRIQGHPIPLHYAYAPGESHDGVTVRIPIPIAQDISAAILEWAVPGLREAKVLELLRALPKALRRDLMPFAPKVTEIVRDFEPSGSSFHRSLAQFIQRRFKVIIPVDVWSPDSLPAHLQSRIELLAPDDKVLRSGRNLGTLLREIPKAAPEPTREAPEWLDACRKWERPALTDWSFPDLPESISLSKENTLSAWPGLEAEGTALHDPVNLRLYRSRHQSRSATLAGIHRLIERALTKDLAWAERDLRALHRCAPKLIPTAAVDDLKRSSLAHIRRHLLPAQPFDQLTRAAFDTAVNDARKRLQGLVPRFIDQVESLLDQRRQLEAKLKVAARPITTPATTGPTGPSLKPRAPTRTLQSLADLSVLTTLPSATPQSSTSTARLGVVDWLGELNALLPADFLDKTPHDRLPHVNRHLKALAIRHERAILHPAKDQERQKSLEPYVDRLRQLDAVPNSSPDRLAALSHLRWMIDEYKVSLFAQELGTAFPVSSKRLDEQIRVVQEA